MNDTMKKNKTLIEKKKRAKKVYRFDNMNKRLSTFIDKIVEKSPSPEQFKNFLVKLNTIKTGGNLFETSGPHFDMFFNVVFQYIALKTTYPISKLTALLNIVGIKPSYSRQLVKLRENSS